MGCTVLGGLLGCKRSTVVTPHEGVARAGVGINAPSATTAGAMSSGRIRIFLNCVIAFIFSFLFDFFCGPHIPLPVRSRGAL